MVHCPSLITGSFLRCSAIQTLLDILQHCINIAFSGFDVSHQNSDVEIVQELIHRVLQHHDFAKVFVDTVD